MGRLLLVRFGQTMWLVVLMVVSVGAVSAAPWYEAVAFSSAATANVAAAPAPQRVLNVTRRVDLTREPGSPLPATRADVADALHASGVATQDAVIGLQTVTTVGSGGAATRLVVAGRERACEHMVVAGACPATATDLLLSKDTAVGLGLGVGDTLVTHVPYRVEDVTYRVVGVYEPADVGEPYWTGTGLLRPRGAVPPGPDRPPDTAAAFATESGVLRSAVRDVDVAYHAVLPVSAFTPRGGNLGTRLSRARDRLVQHGYVMATDADVLARRVSRAQAAASLGVAVVTVQMLLLCWLCVFLATRPAAEARRADLALLKIRGAGRPRQWAYSIGHVAVPLVGGGVVGWLVGYAAALLLAAQWLGATVPPIGARVTWLAAVAAAVAVSGAVVVAVASESRSLRAPVASLLQGLGQARSRWRADLADGVVVVVALAAAVQAWSERDAERPTVLPLVASALLTLAVGVLAARAVAPAMARIGARLMRSGHMGPALAALHLARRPAANRIIATLVLAAALVPTAAVGWCTSEWNSQRRAEMELGAARVLSVEAANPEHLMSVVRRSDPGGRDAMAVALAELSLAGPVLAVDAPRLASVALWRPEYGVAVTDVVRALRPPAPAAIELADGPLTLWARVPAGAEPATVTASVARPDGVRTDVVFPPTDPQGQPVTARLAGCPPDAGCRLVSLRGSAGTVALRRLDDAMHTAVPPTVFGDPTRWRPAATVEGLGGTIAARGDHLVLSGSTNPLPRDRTIIPDLAAYVVDAPVPLPIVVAGRGSIAVPASDHRLAVIGTNEVPYRIARHATALPLVGVRGALVDLESATRVSTISGPRSILQVWLRAGAPQSIVDALVAARIAVVRDEAVAASALRYARQGAGAAAGFALFGAGLGLLVAVGSIFVVAAPRGGRMVRELGAARTQGVSRRAIRVAAFAPPAVLVAVAVPVGAWCSLLLPYVVPPPPADGDPSLGSLGPGAHLAAALVAVAVVLICFGLAAALSVRSLARAAVRGEIRPR